MRTSVKEFEAALICFACGVMAMDCRAGAEPTGTNDLLTLPVPFYQDLTNEPPVEPIVYRKSIIDTVQGGTSTRIVSLARWVDSFFDDPEYVEEQEADARAALKQTVTFYRDLEPSYSTSVRATIVLPNLSRRLRLTFEGNDDLDPEDYTGNVEESLADSTQQSLDDPSFRLQYLFLKEPDIDLGLNGGIRLNESALYVGPRFRLRGGIGSGWDAKFTQRVYWYTTDNLKTKTELRFDHLIGERNLFRQAFRTDWNEETRGSEGFRNTLTTSITQPLHNTAALRYAWSSLYLTRPDHRWTSTTLSLGYRQSVWRDWFILEISPFVRWEEQYNWGPNTGLALSVNAIFEQK